MPSETQEIGIAWNYHAHGFGPCPICDTAMIPAGKSGMHMCPSDTCPFVTDEGVQNVLGSLAPDDDAGILEACEIARIYTLGVQDERGREFHITDKESADWFLAKLAANVAEIEEIDEMRHARIKEINERADFLKAGPQQHIDYLKARFLPELEAYVAEALKGKREKSVGLIHGKAGFRASRGKTNIFDLEAGLEYARQVHPEWIRIEETLYAGPIKDALESGTEPEVEQFARVEEAGDKFYFDVEIPKGGELE